MATQVLGTRYGGQGLYCTDYFYYTASSTETKYTLTLYSGVRFINDSGPSVAWGARATTLTGTGQTAKTGSVAAWRQGSNVTSSDKTAVASFSWSWNKTTSAQTVMITAYTTSPSNHASQKASKSFTIPALKSYTVSYNANGGSGAPSSQIKYYGKALTLSTSKPTRTGYTFKGWATTQARANDGYIDYSSGGTVDANTNSALTLYAVWDLNYVKPKITNISVERCLSDGTQDDEGKYALVTFDWAIDGVKYPSNAVDSLTVQVGTDTSTPTVSGQSGTNLSVIVGSNSFDTDTEYPVTITLSDTSEQTSNTTVVTQTLTVAKFPIDISETGDEMGLMMAARSGQTLTIPRDSYIDNVNIWDSLHKVDYITEKGTSNGWRYRKWNSGWVEAWCYYSVGSVAITTSSTGYGGYRSAGITITIPSGIFPGKPGCQVQKATAQGGWIAHATPASATQISIMYGSSMSHTITDQYVYVYAYWYN